jgi:hypothetical protein
MPIRAPRGWLTTSYMFSCQRCPEVLRRTVRFWSRGTWLILYSDAEQARSAAVVRWLGRSSLRARPRGTPRNSRTFPSASIAIYLITMSSAACHGPPRNRHRDPSRLPLRRVRMRSLEAAAQMSPHAVRLQHGRFAVKVTPVGELFAESQEA